MRSGGKILVDQLISRGISSVYCVPGESYMEILNALYDVPDKIKVFNARHEAGAANMAEAYGKLTGTPGIALVTRGPGACHASIGVHIAFQDSTPMILIVGQVSQGMKDREAFQEIDYKGMFGPISKWCSEIDSAERIPEYLAKAYNLAISGRPGPIVLSVPENVLIEKAKVDDSFFTKHSEPAPEKNVEQVLRELLASVKRPMILLGGSSWCKKASANVLSFAERNLIPVTVGFRRQDIFDNESSVFCGAFGTSVAPSLLQRFEEVDLLLVIGSRLGEMTTNGYDIFKRSEDKKILIHVHVDPNELGSVYPPDLGVVSSVKNFSEMLCEFEINRDTSWSKWCHILRLEYLADLKPAKYYGSLDLGKIFNHLDRNLPENTIVTLDAGNHTGWPQRFLSFSPCRRQIASTCGAMGYSIPAAVAVALALPNKKILCFIGDGGFMMSGMELMTAAQYGASPIVIVFNNRSYGTIRMHQERDHPGRVIATDLKNPDFKAMALAMGAHGELVENTHDFFPALKRCLSQKKPAVIELRTDINQLSTRFNLNQR